MAAITRFGTGFSRKEARTFSAFSTEMQPSRLKPVPREYPLPVGPDSTDTCRRLYNLTLANVDSFLAWLSADNGPDNGARTIACGIGIIDTC